MLALVVVAFLAGLVLGWRATLAWTGGELVAVRARATAAETARGTAEKQAAREADARKAVQRSLDEALDRLAKAKEPGTGLAMLREEQKP